MMLTYIQIQQVKELAGAYDYVNDRRFCPENWAKNPSFRLDGVPGAMVDQCRSDDSRYFKSLLKTIVNCLAVGYADKNEALKEEAKKALLLIEHLYRNDPDIQRSFDRIFSGNNILLETLKAGANRIGVLESVLWAQRVYDEETERVPRTQPSSASANEGRAGLANSFSVFVAERRAQASMTPTQIHPTEDLRGAILLVIRRFEAIQEARRGLFSVTTDPARAGQLTELRALARNENATSGEIRDSLARIATQARSASFCGRSKLADFIQQVVLSRPELLHARASEAPGL